MTQEILNKYIFFILSFIPISFLIGPAISLINILLIDISFIFLIFYKKDWEWIKNKNIKILLFLYAYLIFNSFISLDPSVNYFRNIGFVRFIIFFAAINYFFSENQIFKKIFTVWLIIIIVVCCDIYLEKLTGNNILGYGKDVRIGRIVSFFKEEPIPGSYVASFFLLIIGDLFNNNKKNNFNFLIILLTIIIFSSIIITGERSASIKAFLGMSIFYLIYFKDISFKKKLFSLFIIVSLLFIFIENSPKLKYRFYKNLTLEVKRTILPKKYVGIYPENLQPGIYLELYKSGFLVF